MSLFELLIMFVPLIWFLEEVTFLEKEKRVSAIVSWLVGGIGCFGLSFVLVQKLSALLRGGYFWSEVIYYGWFLFALFTILRAAKKCFLFFLDKIDFFPFSERINIGIKKTIAFVLLYILSIPFFLVMVSVHRPKINNIQNPQSVLSLPYEDVTLYTKDNLIIRGWFVPAKSQKAVIIAHGLGANKSNFIGAVDMWNFLGFNVLIFDFRGHGDSEGHTITFGYKERYEIMAGMDYLIHKKEFLPENIWGYGVSFGASAMIHAASQDNRFKGLVIDSSFASLEHMAQRVVEKQVFVPPFGREAIKNLGLFFLSLDLGYDLRRYSPQEAIGSIKGLPILFIHGKGDPLVPWTETQVLYDRAQGPKQLFWVNTSGHYMTLEDPEYIETIRNFVNKDEK